MDWSVSVDHTPTPSYLVVYYKTWLDPLATLKQRPQYVPLATLVSMADQIHIREELMKKWRPDQEVSVDSFLVWLRDVVTVFLEMCAIHYKEERGLM